jgi:hypothetical protein
MDVRMLGTGRPFAFIMENPRVLAPSVSAKQISAAQSDVNAQALGRYALSNCDLRTMERSIYGLLIDLVPCVLLLMMVMVVVMMMLCVCACGACGACARGRWPGGADAGSKSVRSK